MYGFIRRLKIVVPKSVTNYIEEDWNAKEDDGEFEVVLHSAGKSETGKDATNEVEC